MDRAGKKAELPGRRVREGSAASRMAKAKGRELARLNAAKSADSPSAPMPNVGSTEDNGTAQPPIRARPDTGYDVERAAYPRQKAELLRDAPGRFVVFVGEAMIGPFDDFPTSVEAGYRTFGLGRLYIKEILAEEPRIEFRTYF